MCNKFRTFARDMATILSIDTSTRPCSVAIARNGEVILDKSDFEGQNHGKLLGVFVKELLDALQQLGGQLDAVALSEGPGSYTGLRIGTSLAKGLCFGLDIPLIAIPTHKVMAEAVRNNHLPEGAILCPMIDARRMEVYATLYNTQLEVVRTTGADIIDETSYNDYLNQGDVYFFGDGADKCKTTLTHPNAHFVDHIHPLASQMARLAEEDFAARRFVDVAYFEPFYLKEFVAVVPKNKVF